VRLHIRLPGPFSVSTNLTGGGSRRRSSGKTPRPETKQEIRDRGITVAMKLFESTSYLSQRSLTPAQVQMEGVGALAEKVWRDRVRHTSSTRDGYLAAVSQLQKELREHRRLDSELLKEARSQVCERLDASSGTASANGNSTLQFKGVGVIGELRDDRLDLFYTNPVVRWATGASGSNPSLPLASIRQIRYRAPRPRIGQRGHIKVHTVDKQKILLHFKDSQAHEFISLTRTLKDAGIAVTGLSE